MSSSKTSSATTSPGQHLGNLSPSVAQRNTASSSASSTTSSESPTSPRTTSPSATFSSPPASSFSSSSDPSRHSRTRNQPSSHQPPRAAILGAGISGLSASLALRRAGWSCTIFERSLFSNETGAAITLPPNASLCLSRWGFDFEKTEAVANWSSRLARADTLEVVLREEYKGFGFHVGQGPMGLGTTGKGGGCWGVHRAGLHLELRELVMKDGIHVHGDMMDNGIERNGESGKVLDGGPVDIELGREVVGLDCEKGVIEFKDGTKLEGWDLVVVADGAHSRLLPFILPPSLGLLDPKLQNSDPQEPQAPQPNTNPQPLAQVRPTGRSIYRFLLPLSPQSPLLTNPHFRPHFLPYTQGGPLPGFLSWHDPIKDVLWVSYPCRGGRVINNAIVHNTQRHKELGEADGAPGGSGNANGWSTPVKKEDVLKLVSGFHESVRSLVEMAYANTDTDTDEQDLEVGGDTSKEKGTGTVEKGIILHHLFTRPPLRSFIRGRAVVIGDAAHVMLPTHAAAGAIAIESAAMMEVLFREFPSASPSTSTSPSSCASDHSQLAKFVQRRLNLFDQLRVPRCNLTMLASNAGPKWLNVKGVEEEVRRFYKGRLPGKDALPWTKEFREVLFCYDAFEEAERAVRRELEEEAVRKEEREEDEVAAAVSGSAEAKEDSEVKIPDVKVSMMEAENM
ncbi:hypothetical protein SMACR_08516 [Sordaria macrospora]|uniref:FAD/NAD(P)-binding domain-containing protein n=1 Tax=Sordaria macrospora TaxID=5147 RepID=A0A8S8ZU78_SORMA|nr:hypothetical protein SMACR_08516 [Sordaria macrospora]WPJ57173.1 hypothetical protein SMAC4_08516 [Sordaria macrospora]